MAGIDDREPAKAGSEDDFGAKHETETAHEKDSAWISNTFSFVAEELRKIHRTQPSAFAGLDMFLPSFEIEDRKAAPFRAKSSEDDNPRDDRSALDDISALAARAEAFGADDLNSQRVRLAGGAWRQFDRSTDGTIMGIRDSAGLAFVSDDGINFKMLGSDLTVSGKVTMDESGSFKFNSEEYTITCKSGSELLAHNANGQLLYRINSDGSYIKYDEHGKISETVDLQGNRRQYSWDGDKLVGFTEKDGARFESFDGKHWQQTEGPPSLEPFIKGTYELAADGSFKFTDLENQSETLNLDGSIVKLDSDKRPVFVQDKLGNSYTVFYGESGPLEITRNPSGETLVKDGDHWLNWKTGEKLRSITVDKDGTLHETKLDGSKTTLKTDGWQEITDRNGHRFEFRKSDKSLIVKDERGRITATEGSKGNRSTFKYNDVGALIEIDSKDLKLSSIDGINWQRQPGDKNEQLDISISESGALLVRNRETGNTSVENLDTSKIVFDASGRVLETLTARGELHKFGYDENGQLNKIIGPGADEVYTSTDGEHWSQEGSNRTKHMRVELNGEGTLTVTGLKSGISTVWDLAGNVLQAKEDRLLLISKHDGTYTRFSYDRDGNFTGTENRLENGNVIFKNENEQVVRIVGRRGWELNFGYDESGKLNYFKGINNTLTLNDKNEWIASGDSKPPWTGKMSVNSLGELTMESESGNTRISRLDGSYSLVSHAPAYSRLDYDARGRLASATYASGTTREFSYDENGNLNRILEHDGFSGAGRILSTTDGKHWVSNSDQAPFSGGIYLAKNGTITEFLPEGRRVVERVRQQPVVIDRQHLEKIARELFEAIHPPRPERPPSRFDKALDLIPIDESVKDVGRDVMRFVVDSGLSPVTTLTNPGPIIPRKDPRAAAEILQNLSEPERAALEQIYGGMYKLNLAKDLLNFDTRIERERALSALRHRDGVVDYAGNIRLALLDLEATGIAYVDRTLGLTSELRFDRQTRIQEIFDNVCRLDSKTLARLNLEYKSRFGISLIDTLDRNPNLSEAEKLSLKIYLYGTDVLTKGENKDLTLKLAYIALKDSPPNLQLFQTAFRSAPQEARDAFLENGGEAKLKEAFGPTLVAAALKASFIEANLDPNLRVTDRDFRHALDYVKYGELSILSILKDNTSCFIGDSEQVIEDAIASMSDSEREMCMIGKAMTQADHEEFMLAYNGDKAALARYGLTGMSDLERKFKLSVCLNFKDENNWFWSKFYSSEAQARRYKNISDSYPEFEKLSAKEKTGYRKYYEEVEKTIFQIAGVWFSPQSNLAEGTKWKDMIDMKDGGLLTRLTMHGGWLYTESNQAVFSTVEHMKEHEWEALGGGLPENLRTKEQQEKLEEIHDFISAIKGEKTAGAVMKLIREKLNADTFADSENLGWRRFEDALEHIAAIKSFKALAESLEHMPESERNAYHTNSAFRKALNDKILRYIESPEARQLVFNMLRNSSPTEAPHMDPLDKLNLANLQTEGRVNWIKTGENVLKTNPATPVIVLPLLVPSAETKNKALEAAGLLSSYKEEAIKDLAIMFNDEKKFVEFKQRYLKDENYRNRFERAARKLFDGHGEYDKYIAPLVKSGKLAPEVLLQLNEGLISNDYFGMRETLKNLSPEQKDRLLKNTRFADFAFRSLTEDGKELALNLLDEKNSGPEDVIRGYVLGLCSEEELRSTLGRLMPEELALAKADYFQKYNADASLDLKGALGKDGAEDLLVPPFSPEEAIERWLGRYRESYTGIGKQGVDNCWDGSGKVLNNEANKLIRLEADSTAIYKKLQDSPEIQEKIRNLEAALVNFRNGKEDLGNAIVDLTIAAVAIAAAPLTDGASLAMLACTSAGAAVAAAIFKVAVKSAIRGNDNDLHKVLIDAITGAIDGALTFIGPKELATAFRLGQKAGLSAASKAATRFGSEALVEGAETLLAKEMAVLAGTSLKSSAKAIDETALKALATQALKNADPDSVARLARLLKTELDLQMKANFVSIVNRMLKESGASIGAGAFGGGASGFVYGAASWDPSLSPAENMEHIFETTVTSAGFGAAGAAAFHALSTTAHFAAPFLKSKGRGAAPHESPDLKPHDSGSPAPHEDGSPAPHEGAPAPHETPELKPHEDAPAGAPESKTPLTADQEKFVNAVGGQAKQARLNLVNSANELGFNLPVNRLGSISAQELVQLNSLLKTCGELQMNLPSGVSEIQRRAVLDSVESVIAGLGEKGGSNPLHIANCLKAVDAVTGPRTAQFTDLHASHIADLLIASKNITPELFPDFGHLLTATPEGLARYNSILKQLEGMTPSRYGPDAAAFDAVLRINKLLAASELGAEWAFLPASRGALADQCGIDGAFINLKNGELRPVDFKTNNKSGGWIMNIAERGNTLNDLNGINTIEEFLSSSSAHALSPEFMDKVGLPSFGRGANSAANPAADLLQLEKYLANLNEYLSGEKAAGKTVSLELRGLQVRFENARPTLYGAAALRNDVPGLLSPLLASPPDQYGKLGNSNYVEYKLPEKYNADFEGFRHDGTVHNQAQYVESIRVYRDGRIEGIGGGHCWELGNLHDIYSKAIDSASPELAKVYESAVEKLTNRETFIKKND